MFKLSMVPETRWETVSFEVPQSQEGETQHAEIQIEVKVESIDQIEETKRKILEEAGKPNSKIKPQNVDMELAHHYLVSWKSVLSDEGKEVPLNDNTFYRYMARQDFRTAVVEKVAKIVNREDLLTKNSKS